MADTQTNYTHKPMIIIELTGGLGNQLFQYALGRQLAMQHNTDLFFDIGRLSKQSNGRELYLNQLGIPVPLAPSHLTASYSTRPTSLKRLIHRFCRQYWSGPLHYFRDRHPFELDAGVCQAPDNSYLTGYWQHPGYFSQIATQLRQEINQPLTYQLINNTNQSQPEATVSVCVHVRRGDYIGNRRYDVLPANYYRRAIDVLASRLGQLSVCVFSDDLGWCRQHIDWGHPVVYATPASTLVHLAQMSRYRHFIIPNSTFSWWAAWLGTKADSLIVAPRSWLRSATGLQQPSGLTHNMLIL